MGEQENIIQLGRGGQAERGKIIIRTSIIGIITNVILAVIKASIGLLSNSIAITLDAVNNLSDAASSVITIVGTKIAGKEPDKKHPFGHGRVEYMSAMLVAGIILYAGLTSLIESVKAILNPEEASYGTMTLALVAIAVVVKFLLGLYVRKAGKEANSESLENSGTDALFDSIISLSTLVAAGIFLLTGFSLEAYLGAIIAIIIIKSGIEMLRETVSELLGENAPIELAKEIKKTIISFPNVEGAYDLILHNYGPDRFQGSVHIEIPDTMDADTIDQLVRLIELEVYTKYGVVLTGIGIYAKNTKDDEAREIENKIRQGIYQIPHVVGMHGFHLEKEKKMLRFDVVVSFDSPSRRETYGEVIALVKKLYPELEPAVAMDMDYNEL